MRCPQCGHSNAEGTEECEECGINLDWATENVKETCPACGTENVGFSAKCSNCGYDLERHREKQREEEEEQRREQQERERQGQVALEAKTTQETAQKNANGALIGAILGFFVCGIILEPMAIQQARKAKEVLRPGEPGYGKAQAAEIIAWIGLVLWALGIAMQLCNIISNS